MMIQIVDTTGALIGFMEADAQVRLTFPVGSFSQEFYKNMVPAPYKLKQWTKKEIKKMLKKGKRATTFNVVQTLLKSKMKG